MILPRPAEPFEWRHLEGRPALVCRPLGAIAPHFFSTRQWPLGEAGAPGDGTGWDVVAHAIGVVPANLVRARQVHGASVVIGRQTGCALREADVLIANDDSLALGIQVADCVPILLADPKTGATAAVHAGWRGLIQRAPDAAVAALRREFGCHPDDLTAALGPAIGACCYQVGTDVRDGFAAAGRSRADLDRWFSRVPAADPDNPPFAGLDGSPKSDRWFFDSWACAREQLQEAGVPGARIFSAGLCTASHPDVFCSYRRDGRSAGRLAAAIRIASNRPDSREAFWAPRW